MPIKPYLILKQLSLLFTSKFLHEWQDVIIWPKALYLRNLQKQSARKQYVYKSIASDATPRHKLGK